MHGRANALCGVGGHLRQVATERMRETDVGHEAAPAKRAGPSSGAIEQLIRHQDVERAVFLFKAPNGARRQKPLDAEQLEAVDICPEIELRRQDAVTDTV